MGEENPFSESWNLFGFEGEPIPGVDYSWIQIQSDLAFIGYEKVLKSCTIYYSSRKTHLYLVRTKSNSNGQWDELWNIKDISLAPLASNGSILIATHEERCIHISGVTISFIELLVKTKKLEFSQVSQVSQISSAIPMKLNVKILNKTPDIPDGATSIDNNDEIIQAVVTVSGSALTMSIQGKLDFTTNKEVAVTLDEATFLKIPFSDVSQVDITRSYKIFVILFTNEGTRYEIAFSDVNATEANELVNTMKKEIGKRANEAQKKEEG